MVTPKLDIYMKCCPNKDNKLNRKQTGVEQAANIFFLI